MSAILRRLPPLATTGVGSLPFARPAEAVRHANRAYTLPFCPQLPSREGDMIEEWLGADPGRCGWTPDRDREQPDAWRAFLTTLAADPPAHRVAKLQVTGPVTLAIALERGAGRVGAGAGVTSLARDLAAWLAANTADQVRQLDEMGFDALVVVDEPGLAQAGIANDAADLWDSLRAIAPAWGMHICGHVPWQLINELPLDMLSFDALHGLGRDAQVPLGALLRRGGRIAWGILEPVNPGRSDQAGAYAAACLSALVSDRLPLEAIASSSLLTPSCGTGRLSPASEWLIAATLDAAAHATRSAVAALVAR
jgi:hypothetical protein